MEPRGLRAHAALRAFDNALLGRADDADEDAAEDTGSSDSMALAWIPDTNAGNVLAKLARYQAALKRPFYRALHELQLRHPATPDPGAET